MIASLLERPRHSGWAAMNSIPIMTNAAPTSAKVTQHLVQAAPNEMAVTGFGGWGGGVIEDAPSALGNGGAGRIDRHEQGRHGPRVPRASPRKLRCSACGGRDIATRPNWLDRRAAGAALEVDQRRTSELGSVGADKSAPVIVEARACIVPAVAPAEAAVMAVSEVPPMTEPAVPEAAAVVDTGSLPVGWNRYYRKDHEGGGRHGPNRSF